MSVDAIFERAGCQGHQDATTPADERLVDAAIGEAAAVAVAALRAA